MAGLGRNGCAVESMARAFDRGKLVGNRIFIAGRGISGGFQLGDF